MTLFRIRRNSVVHLKCNCGNERYLESNFLKQKGTENENLYGIRFICSQCKNVCIKVYSPYLALYKSENCEVNFNTNNKFIKEY